MSHQSFDQLHRYIFEQSHCRGELVQLNQSLNQIFDNHQYPQPVKQLLAELMAATSLLTATLKFKGDIAVQLQGDGPVSYAVINGNNQLQLRGMAKVTGEIQNDDFKALLGKGHMVITITPDKGERYQGIVALEGDTLAECLERYFEQSEQLKTRLWIATDINDKDTRAAGLFLQVLPVNQAKSKEDFQHLAVLTDTVKQEELLTLDATTLLTRLYHEDNPEVFPAQPIVFKCSCSREKTIGALVQVDKQSLLEQVAAEGILNVDCQFCLTRYQFSAEDIEQFHQ